MGAFFVIHIRRLSRPKLAPPRFWIALVAGIVVLASILAPVGMLAKASPLRLPGPVDIDLFYLFYLPAALRWPALPFWGGVALLGILATIIPWLLIRKPLPPIRIDATRCTGCTLCAADCPYKAIVMAPREDDSGRKLIAVVNPKLCVSCGVCIGSCSFMAMTLGDRLAQPLWEQTAARVAEGYRGGGRAVKVVFTCERHTAQGAREYVGSRPSRFSETSKVFGADDLRLVVIPVTCIAMAHPDFAAKALAAGAAEVQFVGCPPEDCANREGNVFMQQRLERKRLPRAGQELDAAATAGTAAASDWLPPDDFGRALAAKTHQTAATAYDLVVSRDNWRRLLPVGALLAAVMIATVLLSRVPYAAYAGDQARIEIFLAHRSGAPIAGHEADAGAGAAGPIRLLLEVDGRAVLDKHFPLGAQAGVQTYAQVPVASGERGLRLSLADPALGAQPVVLLDQTATLTPRQIVPVQIKDAHLGGDPKAGEKLFNENARGRRHRLPHLPLAPARDQAGRAIAGGHRGAGRDAACRVCLLKPYLRQSLTEPDAHVVEGYRRGQMPPDYLSRLNQDQLEDLVAYLLSLR